MKNAKAVAAYAAEMALKQRQSTCLTMTKRRNVQRDNTTLSKMSWEVQPSPWTQIWTFRMAQKSDLAFHYCGVLLDTSVISTRKYKSGDQANDRERYFDREYLTDDRKELLVVYLSTRDTDYSLELLVSNSNQPHHS
jgi:hypothetical protein